MASLTKRAECKRILVCCVGPVATSGAQGGFLSVRDSGTAAQLAGTYDSSHCHLRGEATSASRQEAFADYTSSTGALSSTRAG